MINVTPVILCGGSGTRLWPLSRTGFPKQFLCLTGKESLFQQAALRLAGLGNAHIQVAASIIVTGEDHRFLASEQLREINLELGSPKLDPSAALYVNMSDIRTIHDPFLQGRVASSGL